MELRTCPLDVSPLACVSDLPWRLVAAQHPPTYPEALKFHVKCNFMKFQPTDPGFHEIVHPYRPLGDHCERKQIRRCPRRPSRPDCPQGRRRARPAPAPRGSQGGPFGTQHGPGCRLCPRAQQLIAPPRGSLSAVGGIDKPSRGLAALPRACGVWDPLVQAGCRVPAPRSRSRGPRGGSAACGGLCSPSGEAGAAG